mmetsp:Transcript_9506/g.28721  ORF Transcript_9506/g.28721 Transcript_9506/m.28721 type:complete len:80 (+) Transcript_9506:171-410(+)
MRHSLRLVDGRRRTGRTTPQRQGKRLVERRRGGLEEEGAARLQKPGEKYGERTAVVCAVVRSAGDVHSNRVQQRDQGGR